MKQLFWPAMASAFILAGCGGPESGTESGRGTTASENASAASNEAASQTAPASASATLRTAEGAPTGTATATASEGGITVALVGEGLPPGQHGAHVHMTGQCDAPDFKSAGGHWNPSNQQHGLEDPQGQHAGDMPNLMVGEDGRGTLNYVLQGGSFEDLLDADGSAIVIHATADDQKTDPSGNSGDRIACGVFQGG